MKERGKEREKRRRERRREGEKGERNDGKKKIKEKRGREEQRNGKREKGENRGEGKDLCTHLSLLSLLVPLWSKGQGQHRVTTARGARGPRCPPVPAAEPPVPAAPRARRPARAGTCSTLLCTTVPMALEHRRGARPLKSPALPSTFTMCLAGDSGDRQPRGDPTAAPGQRRGGPTGADSP